MKRVAWLKSSAVAAVLVALLAAGLAAPAQASSVSGVVVNGTLSISGTGAFETAYYADPGDNATTEVGLVGQKLILNTYNQPGGFNNALNYTTGPLNAYIQKGRQGGAWTGTTGITDPAAAADYAATGGFEMTGVGSVVNGELLNTAAGADYSTFGGQPVNGNSILVGDTYVGDTTLKGYVDLNDINNVLNGFGNGTNAEGGAPGWEWGDFTGSGTVTLDDIAAVLNGFGDQGAPIAKEYLTGSVQSQGVVANISTVPEPGTLALLACGVMALAGCQLRRKFVRA